MKLARSRNGISTRVRFAAGLTAAAIALAGGVSVALPASGANVARTGPHHTGTAYRAASASDSGLRGQVLYGPTCPVQRPGAICERPYQATVVVFRIASRGTAVRVSTSADGRFSVRLRPGRYLVKVTGHTTFPRSSSQKVTVTAHRFTTVTIRIDSGIR